MSPVHALSPLLRPWKHIEPGGGADLEKELQREIGPGHPLQGVRLQAWAHRTDADDVLFVALPPDRRCFVVHLTWRRRTEVSPAWPSTAVFADTDRWLLDGMLADHLDFAGSDAINLREGMLVGTYNVLAPSYVQRKWFPHTSAHLLSADHRFPALATTLLRLDADVWCLQEVEPEGFAFLEQALSAADYEGHYTRKAADRPDGCATFVRRERLGMQPLPPLYYRDGDPPSGHVAQLSLLRLGAQRVGLVNTHLRWHPPHTPVYEQLGRRQLSELLEALPSRASPELGWIITGDFNAMLGTPALETLSKAGLRATHEACPAPTCNANRFAKMIDFICCSAALRAEPLPIAPVGDDTPLPSETQPSDHVPVMARLSPASARP